MTEQEWQTQTGNSLNAMGWYFVGKASKRKVALFACACCRQLWDHLQVTEIRKCLEAAERYADGRIRLRTASKWYDRARAACAKLAESPCTPTQQIAYEVVMKAVVSPELGYVHNDVVRAIALSAGAVQGTAEWTACMETNGRHLIMLMRDIWGNPFRPNRVEPSSWLTWQDGTVQKIAQVIFEKRLFQHLPILADALEEAGCTDADILFHLRGPGPHVRGCWALDLILGKE